MPTHTVPNMSRRLVTAAALAAVTVASTAAAAVSADAATVWYNRGTRFDQNYVEWGTRHSYTSIDVYIHHPTDPYASDPNRLVCVRKRYDAGGYAPSGCALGRAVRSDYSASKLGFPQTASLDASPSNPAELEGAAEY